MPGHDPLAALRKQREDVLDKLKRDRLISDALSLAIQSTEEDITTLKADTRVADSFAMIGKLTLSERALRHWYTDGLKEKEELLVRQEADLKKIDERIAKMEEKVEELDVQIERLEDPDVEGSTR